ncbi:MAG: MgtC/SapB family protein [Geminicoccaceae bacterium]
MLEFPESLGDLPEMLLRLGAAALLGGILGLERELKDKPLGLRTNMLMALGACAFGLLTVDVVELFRRDPELGHVDPSRVIQGIVEGIGFLGTGAIIQARGNVQGATTGATIWVVGAIGIACSFGLLLLAVTVTGIALLVLAVLGGVERLLRTRPADGG